MQRSSGPRKTVNRSDSIYRQLSGYAIAAVVAVLSALALTEQSEAKIVYTPVTVQLSKYSLDVNNDGITDFTLQLQGSFKHDEGCHSWNISAYLSDVATKGNVLSRMAMASQPIWAVVRRLDLARSSRLSRKWLMFGKNIFSIWAGHATYTKVRKGIGSMSQMVISG